MSILKNQELDPNMLVKCVRCYFKDEKKVTRYYPAQELLEKKNQTNCCNFYHCPFCTHSHNIHLVGLDEDVPI